MATAIRLSIKGYSVEVFESNSYIGGKLSQIESNNFRFDAGHSLFTMPELVDEWFELANKNPRQYFNYLQLEESCFKLLPAMQPDYCIQCSSSDELIKLRKLLFNIKGSDGKKFISEGYPPKGNRLNIVIKYYR